MATPSATSDEHAKPDWVQRGWQIIALGVAATLFVGTVAYFGFGWRPHTGPSGGGGYEVDRRPPAPPSTPQRRAPAPERVEQTMPPGMPPDASEKNPYVYKGREYFWKHADCPGRIIHPYTGKPVCPK